MKRMFGRPAPVRVSAVIPAVAVPRRQERKRARRRCIFLISYVRDTSGFTVRLGTCWMSLLESEVYLTQVHDGLVRYASGAQGQKAAASFETDRTERQRMELLHLRFDGRPRDGVL